MLKRRARRERKGTISHAKKIRRVIERRGSEIAEFFFKNKCIVDMGKGHI